MAKLDSQNSLIIYEQPGFDREQLSGVSLPNVPRKEYIGQEIYVGFFNLY